MDNRALSKRIKYSLIYYCVLFLIWLSNFLPRKTWLSLCGFLGRTSYHVLGETRNLVIKHLTLAYSREKTAAEIHSLSKKVFTMLGKNAGDILRARRVKTLADLDKFIVVHGMDNFKQASAKGKGVIFLTSHLGAFDLQITVMALHGLKPNIIGTPLKDLRLNELLFDYRNAYGAVAVERGKETFRLIKALKSAGSVAILIDQDTKVKSRFVNFFGMPAATPVGASILAMKTGAAIVPTYIFLGNDGMQHMHLLPEIPWEERGNEEENLTVNTQRYTNFIQDVVRQHPEQWVWMHERWKTKLGEEIV